MENLTTITNTKDHEKILHINFNQDQGCFACATETGFIIYNSYPYKETFSRDLGGGIGYIEMLYRSNILGIVGGGKKPRYTLNKVMIWDDHQIKSIGEMSFRSEVKAVKLRSQVVVVVLDYKIFVYNFSDLKQIKFIETAQNSKGLCSVNNENSPIIIACPHKTLGQVSIHNLMDDKKELTIRAHQSILSCIELNNKGDKLATASEKGTVIRIYNLEDGTQIQELRRGMEYAQIFSLCFDPTGFWLACSSDSKTIHIFSLKEDRNSASKNQKSKFSFIKAFSSYFDSEWSFAQFRIPDIRAKVAFGPESNTILVVSEEGNYYVANFDPVNGGECLKQQQTKFFNV